MKILSQTQKAVTSQDSKENEEKTKMKSRKSRFVAIILASTALATLGVPFISPALPIIRDVFSVTDAQASLLVSAYFAVGIVFSPFIGVLEDRVGRRPILGSSLIIFGITGGLLLFVPEFWMILAIRFVQGTAAAGLFITTVTLISDTFDGAKRDSVLGLNNAVLSIGAAIFPVLGGFLVTITWNTPFVVYLVAIPLGLVALKFVEEPVKEVQETKESTTREKITAIVGQGTITAYASAIVVEILLFGTVLTALPFYLSRVFELGPVAIGAALSIGSISAAISAVTSGKLSENLSSQKIIALSFFLYGIGLIGFWSATSYIWILASGVIFGSGTGLSLPAIDSLISTHVSDEFRGKALGVRNGTTFLGRTAGPILFTAIGLMIGYPALLLAASILILGAAPLLFAFSETSLGKNP